MKPEDQFHKEHTKFIDDVFKMATFVFVVAVLAIAAYMYWFRSHKISTDPGDWGAFGDYVGGLINPAVGLVTVILIIVSISMQRKELHNSLVEMKEANRAATKMAFEQSLFAWLENYHSQIKSIQIEQFSGRKALYHLYDTTLSPKRTIAFVNGSDDFRLLSDSDYQANQIYLQVWPSNQPSEKMAYVQFRTTLKYTKAYIDNKAELDAPFRTIYRLIRWIDSSDLDAAGKWHYCALIRSQLAWPELVCLYYNCLIREGEKLAKYANKYALFDNLDISDELIRYALGPLTDQPAADRPKTRDGDAPWPFTRSAFDSSTAKAQLNLPLDL